jgi:hypothetical protein
MLILKYNNSEGQYIKKAPIRSRLVEPYLEDPFSYSRLSTWLSCSYKGHKVYDQGFESGTEASHNIQGKVVHVTAEVLHQTTNVWNLTKKETIEKAHKILDGIWAKQLGGREDLAFVKNYIALTEQLYEECKKRRERQTNKPCRAPWMTTMWQKEYKPLLAAQDRHLDRIGKLLNIVEYDTLPAIVKNSYQFVETYCRLIHQEFLEPEELYLEYEDDPLVIFEGCIEKDLGLKFAYQRVIDKSFVFPFRGAIDQIWFSVSKSDDIYIYDIKTSRSGWNKDKILYHDQLWLYCLHVYQTFGRLPTKLGIIDARNGSVVDIEPTLAQLERFRLRYLKKIALVMLIKKERLYVPASGDSVNMCSFCEVGNSGACEWYSPKVPPHTPNKVPIGAH